MFALAFLLLPAGSTLFSSAESSTTVPVTEITGVVSDDTVSVRTHNFPANTDFTVTMGPMGTRGINGYVVGTINSGAGGSFDANFKIPPELYGSYQVSIRLQSGGYYPYYSYNWFYNNTTGAPETAPPETPTEPPATPDYSGIPTFKIVAVARNASVTIETNNFPANQTFNVTMGPMGTRGINGIHVGTLESGAGGQLTETYTIPPELYDHTQISIRAQTAHAYPYYAYNWFWNNDANVATADSGTGGAPADSTAESETTSTTEADSGASTSTGTSYYGIPVIVITGVVRDQEVTFQTYNYPPNQDFTVTMGPMGTQGINGIMVGDFNSGSGGSLTETMPIPAELAGSHQISIRAQTYHPYPFFSYNWFYNNTTSP